LRMERYKAGRNWAVYDDAGKLVVITVYKRGAQEVMRRLSSGSSEGEADGSASPSLVLERKEESYGSGS
jgi:hypothetical protein